MQLAERSRREIDLRIHGVRDPYEVNYPKSRGEYAEWEPLDRHLEALEHAELILYREIKPAPDHDPWTAGDHEGIIRVIDLDERGLMRLDADVAAIYRAWQDRPAGTQLELKPNRRMKTGTPTETLEERLARRRSEAILPESDCPWDVPTF